MSTTPAVDQTNGPSRWQQLRTMVGQAASAPVHGAGGAMVSGVVDQLTSYWQQNHPEITNQVREVFGKALLGQSPQAIRSLYQTLISLLIAPSADQLQEITRLLPQITPEVLRALSPSVTDPQIEAVLSLQTRFFTGVGWINNAFVLSDDLRAHLDSTAALLKTMIDRNDGVLVQCLQFANNALSEGKERFMNEIKRLGGVAETPLPIGPQPGSDEPSAAEGLSLNSIMDRGGQFLNSLVSMGSNAISSRAASALATLFHLVLEQVRGGISTRDMAHPLLGQIDPLIARLRASIQAPSWQVLIATLQETLTFLRQQHIYFQGFKVPLLNNGRTHLSAIPPLLQNISSHKAFLHKPTFEEAVTEERMTHQANVLKANISAYIPMTLVSRMLKWDNLVPIDAHVFQNADSTPVSELPSLFKSSFFKKIDASRNPIGLKWIAKRTYELIGGIAAFYCNSIIHKVFSLAKELISDEAHTPDSKQEFIIKTLRNWLAVTSGAYNQAAEAPSSKAKDLLAMIEEMMKLPERNDGMTQSQVYSATLKSLLHVFGPKIAWTQSIGNFFKREIPSTSPLYFLNPVVKGINFVLAASLKTIAFLPQWTCNGLIWLGTWLVSWKADLMQDFIEQKVDSMKRNSPTSFAMQKMVYHQLQNVLKTIEEKLGKEEGGDPTVNITHARRHEISGLIKYGLEVLNKCRYLTKDDLNNFLQHKAPLKDRLIREVEETFLPQVLETAAQTLSLTLRTVTSEAMMRQSLYEMFCVANASFGPEGKVTDAEFLSIQKGISELRDQILEATTLHAVEELLDFTNAKQQRDLDQFMAEFKEQAIQFTNVLLHELYETSLISNGSSIPLQGKISQLVELSIQFHQSRLDALSKADGNRNLHASTKQDLNVISQELINHSTPVAGCLNGMKFSVDRAVESERLLPDHFYLQMFLSALQPHFQKERFSHEDRQFCTVQLDLAQVHMNSLKEKNYPQTEQNVLELQLHQIRSSIDGIHLRQKEEELFQRINWNIIHLQQEKLRNAPPEKIQEIILYIISDINGLSFPESRKIANDCLQALIGMQSDPQFNGAMERWRAEVNILTLQNSGQIHSHFEQIRGLCSALQQRLVHSSNQYLHNFAESKNAIQSLIHQSSLQAQALHHWANGRASPNLWNIMPFDMNWATETIKNLAFSSSQDKMQMLLDTLHQKHNIIGFLSQVGLLPWLRHSGYSKEAK